MFSMSVAILSLVLAATWKMSGYTMAMCLAGLLAIPADLREAGRVDGATGWQIVRFVIWPLLRPATLAATIILSHISLKIYDLVVAMTGLGPGLPPMCRSASCGKRPLRATALAGERPSPLF
jgi:glucose/mannose transport system permease protein